MLWLPESSEFKLAVNVYMCMCMWMCMCAYVWLFAQVSGCTGNFTMMNREQSCIQYIRDKVGDSKVLVSDATPL